MVWSLFLRSAISFIPLFFLICVRILVSLRFWIPWATREQEVSDLADLNCFFTISPVWSFLFPFSNSILFQKFAKILVNIVDNTLLSILTAFQIFVSIFVTLLLSFLLSNVIIVDGSLVSIFRWSNKIWFSGYQLRLTTAFLKFLTFWKDFSHVALMRNIIFSLLIINRVTLMWPIYSTKFAFSWYQAVFWTPFAAKNPQLANKMLHMTHQAKKTICDLHHWYIQQTKYVILIDVHLVLKFVLDHNQIKGEYWDCSMFWKWIPKFHMLFCHLLAYKLESQYQYYYISRQDFVVNTSPFYPNLIHPKSLYHLYQLLALQLYQFQWYIW